MNGDLDNLNRKSNLKKKIWEIISEFVIIKFCMILIETIVTFSRTDAKRKYQTYSYVSISEFHIEIVIIKIRIDFNKTVFFKSKSVTKYFVKVYYALSSSVFCFLFFVYVQEFAQCLTKHNNYTVGLENLK